MEISKRKLKEILVLNAVFAFYFSTLIFKMSTMESFAGISSEIWYSIARRICYFLLLLAIFVDFSLSKYSFISISVIVLGVIISYMNLPLQYFMDIVMFAIATIGIDKRKIVKSVLISLMISTTIICIMANNGLIENLQYIKYFDGRTVTRSMGFGQINWFGAIITECLFCWCYLQYDRFSILDLILIGCLLHLVNVTSYSRTAMYLMILLLLMIVVIKLLEHFNFERMLLPLGILAVTVGPIVSVIMTVYFTYSNPVYVEMNLLMSQRLSINQEIYLQNGISPFGQQLTGEISAFDNAYMRCLVWYGAILFVLYMLFMILVAWKSLKIRDYALFILILLYSIQGIFESFPLFLRFNFTYLLYAGTITGNVFIQKKMKRDARVDC